MGCPMLAVSSLQVACNGRRIHTIAPTIITRMWIVRASVRRKEQVLAELYGYDTLPEKSGGVPEGKP